MAVAGLLIAAGVGVIAGKLTSQRIGISAEPLEAGQALAPAKQPAKGTGKHRNDGKGKGDKHKGDKGGPDQTTTSGSDDQPPPATTTTTVPATPPPAPPDDSGGEGGEGGGDDD